METTSRCIDTKRGKRVEFGDILRFMVVRLGVEMSGSRFAFLTLYIGFMAVKTFPQNVGTLTNVFVSARRAAKDVDYVATLTARCGPIPKEELQE